METEKYRIKGKIIHLFDKILKSRYFTFIPWIVSILACFVSIFSAVNNTFYKASSYHLSREMHSAKKEITRNRMINYIDTITHIEQKRYLSIEDSLWMYITYLDDFNKYKIKASDDEIALINSYSHYYNQITRLFNSKSYLLSTINGYQADSAQQRTAPLPSVEKLSLLLYKMEDFNDSFIENQRKYQEIIARSSHDINEIERCLKEDYTLCHSKKFYDMELCFLSFVTDYNQKVKTALKKE